MSIASKEDLLNKQKEAQEKIDSYTCRILVCSGTGCVASGSQKIYDEMVKLCEGLDNVEVSMQKDVPHIGTVKTGCQGLCELGPLVRIEPQHLQYVHVQIEDCKEIVKKMRGERPFVFTNIRGDENVDIVVEWIKKNVLLEGM